MGRSAPQEKALIARPATAREAMPLCGRVAEFDTTGGVQSLLELLEGGACYVIEHGGEAVGAWSQRVADGVIYVRAYGGRAEVNLIDALQSVLEHQRPRAVQFQTRRRGLIRKATRRGWRVIGEVASGYVLRKEYTT